MAAKPKPILYKEIKTGMSVVQVTKWKVIPMGVVADFKDCQGEIRPFDTTQVAPSDFSPGDPVKVRLEAEGPWVKATVQYRRQIADIIGYVVQLEDHSEHYVKWSFDPEENEIRSTYNFIGYILRDWELIDTKKADSEEELQTWYESHLASNDPKTKCVIKPL